VGIRCVTSSRKVGKGMESLLDRFIRYVKIDTTAVEEAARYPSSPGQLEMGKLLARELGGMGVTDAAADENGIVLATIPGNVAGAPVIAFVAHMDTSPESSGANVTPIIHRDYEGGDIVLPGDSSKVIRRADSPVLGDLIGKTLITTDGKTLLGADDKAGIAVIMKAVEQFMSDPSLPHGPIRIAFTCDEEVGRGVEKLTPEMLGAIAAYTLDGESAGSIENETFSADLAVVTIKGKNIHPGLAKDKMVNSIRLAAEFVARMPWENLSPEATEGREGFLHPYVIEGGVAETKIRILLRSFVEAGLDEERQILREIAQSLQLKHPKAAIDIEIKRQYRNMIDALEKEPRAVSLALEAVQSVGLSPVLESIRGGTDGSRLSEMGLPTPNLGVGMHNFHSPLEYACLEEMEKAVDVVVTLAQLWSAER
jgi:tripeptide aminopeptidase